MTATTTPGTSLNVQRISKTFSSRNGTVPALQNVSFTVADGQFYSIVGPSGCGKSTLLNVIAGLEPEDTGTIHLGVPGDPGGTASNSPVDRAAPSAPYPAAVQGDTEVAAYQNESTRADSRLGTIGYMPQKDLLLPWRTVLDNAALGLELTGVSRTTARERARSLLDRFGLDGFADSYPAELSGGMRQRAAFLRTVLTDRSLMLLDEPFGALDALTRRSMQEWLLGVWSKMQRTVVLITHDVDEAIFLSDRVAVMSPRPGRIVAEHPVDLPRPRSAEMITSREFIELKRRIMVDLRTALEGSDDADE